MTKAPVTAVILAKNEAAMLSGCLATVRWCEQIVLLDDNSTDQTVEIAQEFGAKIVHFSSSSFAELRTEALSAVSTEWVFYIDADERVTPELAQEITTALAQTEATALRMKRSNIFFGRVFRYGGWQDDLVTRVFKTQSLKGWQGSIHESPVFSGEVHDLQHELIHFSHRSIVSGLYKTASWTPMEAELLFHAGIPHVSVVTLIRKGVMEFVRRAVLKKGYKDGEAGIIEAVVQGINRVLVYAQVWELQQRPPLTEQYARHEAELEKAWSAKS